RALGDGLLHPLPVGLRAFRLDDPHHPVVADLEHIVGDRLADAVAGADRQIDLDSHIRPIAGYCTYAGTRLMPCTKLLSRYSGSPNSMVRSRVSSSRNRFRSSLLASWLPRQKCGPPPPNPTCGLGIRCRMKACGSSNTDSSRFAEQTNRPGW